MKGAWLRHTRDHDKVQPSELREGNVKEETMLLVSPKAKRWHTLNALTDVLHLRMPVVTCLLVGCPFLSGREWSQLSTMTFAPLPVLKSG